MHLRVTLPFHVEVDEPVLKVSAEGDAGGFCLKPKHVDYCASLQPGLLWFVNTDGEEIFLAIDRGLLVKTGENVQVATGQTVRCEKLEDVEDAVANYIREKDEREQQAEMALEKMQADFVRRFAELEH
ncbi:MAG: F0F1 ATP synthase subunit epsilon [Candidatus Sumerlaeota bacterium]